MKYDIISYYHNFLFVIILTKNNIF